MAAARMGDLTLLELYFSEGLQVRTANDARAPLLGNCLHARRSSLGAAGRHQPAAYTRRSSICFVDEAARTGRAWYLQSDGGRLTKRPDNAAHMPNTTCIM